MVQNRSIMEGKTAKSRGFAMRRGSFVILALVVCLFVTPALAPAQEAALKKPWFDSAGVPIHYIVTGKADGEPVVLIHGFTGSIERQWPRVIDALKKDYKVIAMDCRGHGSSGKPHDPKKYGIEMVNDVARLLDHLKIDKAHLAGYSMGASLALAFTVHHPERVRSLTMGGHGVPDPNRSKLLGELAESLDMGKGIGPLIIALAPQNKPSPTPEQIKLIDTAVLAVNDAKALACVIRSFNGNKDMLLSDKQIQEIRVPTAAFIGADDPLRPGVDQFKKLLPKTRVVVIDGADHITAFMRPEFVNGVHQFLNENRQPPKE